MAKKYILSNNTKDEKEILESSGFLKSFSNFLNNYFSFIIYFTILLIWQFSIIFELPYSNTILELFVCIALVQQIKEKFLKSSLFLIPIVAVIILLFVLKSYNIPNTQWIIILGILIGLKIHSLLKKK